MDALVNVNELIITTNRFLGYGEPSLAKCFFIGSEEHDPFTNNSYQIWKRELKTFTINNIEYLYSPKLKPANLIGFERKISYLQYMLQIRYYKDYSNDFETFISDVNNYCGFYGNVKPIGDINENSWQNFELTGYETKEEYFRATWKLEQFSRENTLKDLIAYLKNRINNGEDILIFNFGTSKIFSPYKSLVEIYKSLGFEINENENLNRNEITNQFGNKLWWISSKCKRIWFAQHPGNDWFTYSIANEIVHDVLLELKEKHCS